MDARHPGFLVHDGRHGEAHVDEGAGTGGVTGPTGCAAPVAVFAPWAQPSWLGATEGFVRMGFVS